MCCNLQRVQKVKRHSFHETGALLGRVQRCPYKEYANKYFGNVPNALKVLLNDTLQDLSDKMTAG